MFWLRNSCEFLWYSACNSINYNQGMEKCVKKDGLACSESFLFPKLSLFGVLAGISRWWSSRHILVPLLQNGRDLQNTDPTDTEREVRGLTPDSTSCQRPADTLMLVSLLQASSTSSLSPSCFAWWPVLVWLLMTQSSPSSQFHLLPPQTQQQVVLPYFCIVPIHCELSKLLLISENLW